MKKYILIICSLLIYFASNPLNAQISAGITGTVNFSNIEADEGAGETITGRTLYGIGGVLDFTLTNRVSIQLEPMYIQKGAHIVEQDEQYDMESTYSSSFLEVPSFVIVKLGDSELLPYIFAGPTFGILLKSKLEGETSGLKFSADLKKVTELFDIGFGIGTGFEYPINKFSVFFQSYYVFGLTNAQKGGTFEVSSGPFSQEITWDKKENEYSNRGLRVSFGVKIPIVR